jgi:hypothetical protein
VCAVVARLPDDAAVWRATGPDDGWTRPEVLLAALERRVTLLWATIVTALGAKATEDDGTGPLDRLITPTGSAAVVPAPPERDEPEPPDQILARDRVMDAQRLVVLC